MLVLCVVVGCQWVDSSLFYHRIPKEDKQQPRLNVIKRKHWDPTNNDEFMDYISF